MVTKNTLRTFDFQNFTKEAYYINKVIFMIN